MNLANAKSHMNSIIAKVEFFQNGKGTINKKNNHSDYQKGIYTPEDILGQIKYDVMQALKELDRYK